MILFIHSFTYCLSSPQEHEVPQRQRLHLLCSPLQCLRWGQCLAQNNQETNICWTNDWGDESCPRCSFYKGGNGVTKGHRDLTVVTRGRLSPAWRPVLLTLSTVLRPHVLQGFNPKAPSQEAFPGHAVERKLQPLHQPTLHTLLLALFYSSPNPWALIMTLCILSCSLCVPPRRTQAAWEQAFWSVVFIAVSPSIQHNPQHRVDNKHLLLSIE